MQKNAQFPKGMSEMPFDFYPIITTVVKKSYENRNDLENKMCKAFNKSKSLFHTFTRCNYSIIEQLIKPINQRFR